RPATSPCSTMAPTAAKESQKPADSGAQGSETTTTAAASTSTSEIRPARPVADARAAVASIQQVRCAGIPQPLNRLYAKASASAGHQARTGAGHRSKAAGTRRAQRSEEHTSELQSR